MGYQLRVSTWYQSLVCGYSSSGVASRDCLDGITIDPRVSEEELCLPFLGEGGVSYEDELALGIVYLESNYVFPSVDRYGMACDDRLASLDNAWLILVEISVVIGDVL